MKQVNPQEIQKQMEMIARTLEWMKCLGGASLGSLFLIAFRGKLMSNQPIVDESMHVTVTDDKLIIKIERPISKIDFIGEKGWDYIPSPSLHNIVNFMDARYSVKAIDERIRTVATAQGIVYKKINPNIELEIEEEDEKRALECFPWLKRDVKEILKLIETKYNRKMCKRKRCKLLAQEAES